MVNSRVGHELVNVKKNIIQGFLLVSLLWYEKAVFDKFQIFNLNKVSR